MMLAEYTIAPSWFFTVFDEYNYFDVMDKEGISHKRDLHYLGGAIAYVHGATRVSFGYGRQRSGILCVGGVCRLVPSSNGFNLSVSSSF